MEGGSKFDPLLAQIDKPDLLNDMIPYRCPKCGSLRRFTALRDLKLHLEKEHAFKMECVKPRSRTKVFNHGDTKRGIKFGLYQRTKDGGKFMPQFDNSIKAKYFNKLSQRLNTCDLQRHQDSEANGPDLRRNQDVELSSLSGNAHLSKHPASQLLKSYNDEARILEMKVKIAKEKELSNKLNRDILSKYKGNNSVTSAKQRTDIDDSRPENKFLYSELFVNNTGNNFSVKGYNPENQSLLQDSFTLNRRENLQETLHTINNELLNSRHNQWKKDQALYQAHDVLLGVEEAAENRCLDQQEVIRDLVNDLRQKEVQLTKANQDLERLRQERQALVRETEDLFIQADNGSKVLKKELDRREDMLDNVNEQLHTLKLEATSALERKEDELTLARDKVYILDKERQRLVGETQNLLRQADKERAVLRRSLDHKENQLRRVNKDMERLKTEQDDLVQESIHLYEKANDGTSKLKHLVETKDNQLQQAYRELEEMRDVHEKLIQQSHNLTKQANINSQKLTDMLKIKEMELEKAKQELAEVKDERSKIKVTAKDLAQKASHKDLEVERLQRLVNNKGEQLAGKQKELESLKSFLNTAAEKEFVARDQLEQFINDLINRADKAESELSRLQSQTSSRSHSDVSRSHLNESGSKSESLRSRSQMRYSKTEVESLERRCQRSKSQPTKTVEEEQQLVAPGTTSQVKNKNKTSNHDEEYSNLRKLLEKETSTGNKKAEQWQQILHENYLSDPGALSDTEYQQGEGSQKIDTRLRKQVQRFYDSESSESEDMDPQPKVKNQKKEVAEVKVYVVPSSVTKKHDHNNFSELRHTPDDVPVRDTCDDLCCTTKSSITSPNVPQCIPNSMPHNAEDINVCHYKNKCQVRTVQSQGHSMLSQGHLVETQGHGLPFQGVVQEGYVQNYSPSNSPRVSKHGKPNYTAKNYPKPVRQVTGQFPNRSFHHHYRPTNRAPRKIPQRRELITTIPTPSKSCAAVSPYQAEISHQRQLSVEQPTVISQNISGRPNIPGQVNHQNVPKRLHSNTPGQVNHQNVSERQHSNTPGQENHQNVSERPYINIPGQVNHQNVSERPYNNTPVHVNHQNVSERPYINTPGQVNHQNVSERPYSNTPVQVNHQNVPKRPHSNTPGQVNHQNVSKRPYINTPVQVNHQNVPKRPHSNIPGQVNYQNVSERPYSNTPGQVNHQNVSKQLYSNTPGQVNHPVDKVSMSEQNHQLYNKDLTGVSEHMDQSEHQTWSYEAQYPKRIESSPTDHAEDLSTSQRYSIRPHKQGQGQTSIKQSNASLQQGQGQQNHDGIIYVPFDVMTGQPCQNGQSQISHKQQARAIISEQLTMSPPGQYGRQRRTLPMATNSRQMMPFHAGAEIQYTNIPAPPAGRPQSDKRRNVDQPSEASADFNDNSLADVVSINEDEDFSQEPDDIESEDFEHFMDDNGILWEPSVQLKLNSRRISPAGSEMSQRHNKYLGHNQVNKNVRSRSLSPRIGDNGTRHVTFDGSIHMPSASDGYIQNNICNEQRSLVRGYHSDLDLSRSRDVAGPGIMKTTSGELTSLSRQRSNEKKFNSPEFPMPIKITEKVSKSCQSLKNSGTQTWLLDQPLGKADLEEIRQRSSYVKSVSPSSSHTSPGTNTQTDISYSSPTCKTAVANLGDENSSVSTGGIVTDTDLGLPTDFLYRRRPVRGLTYTSSVSVADGSNTLSPMSLECKQVEDSNVHEDYSVKSSEVNKINPTHDSPTDYHRNHGKCSWNNTDVVERHYVNNQKEQSRNSSVTDSTADHKVSNSNHILRVDNSQSSQSEVTKSFASDHSYSQDFASSSRDQSVSGTDSRDHNGSYSHPTIPDFRDPGNTFSQSRNHIESPSNIFGPNTTMSHDRDSSSKSVNHKQSPINTVNPDTDSCTPQPYSKKCFSPSEKPDLAVSFTHSDRDFLSHPKGPSCVVSDEVSQSSLANQDSYCPISDQSLKSCSKLTNSGNKNDTISEQELQSAAIVSEAITNAFKFLNCESSSKSEPPVENRNSLLPADHKQFTKEEQLCKHNSSAIGIVNQKHKSKQLLDTDNPANITMDTDDLDHSVYDETIDVYHSDGKDTSKPVRWSGRRKKKKKKSKKHNFPEPPPQEVVSDTGTMDTDAELNSLQSYRRTSSVASSEESLLDRLPQSRREEIRARRNALFQIFRYLDTKSLARAAQVSREWRKVSRQSALWKRVCIRDVAISSQDLVQLSSWCTQLQYLSMIDLRSKVQTEDEEIKSTRASLEPGFERLLQVSEATLKSLTIINCGNLLTDKSIWLSSCYSRMMQRVTYLSHTDPLGPDVMWALGAGCGCITALNIPPLYPCSSPDKFNNKCLQIISQCLPDLEVLEFGGQHIDINGLVLIAKACQRLQSLTLHHVSKVTDDIAVALSRVGLKSLRCIAFIHTPVTDQTVLQFYNCCKHLREISVTFSIDDVYENPRKPGNLNMYLDMVTKLKEMKQKAGLGNILKLELLTPDDSFQQEESETSELSEDDNKVTDKEEEMGTIDRIKNFFK